MKVKHLAPALILSLAFLGMSAAPAAAQRGGGHGGAHGSGGGHGGAHNYGGGGAYHGGGGGYAVPRSGAGHVAGGGVAGARHPVAGTGYGSRYYHGYYGGHYGGHYNGYYGRYYYPYYGYGYGYGYYPYYYGGGPYFYGSLSFGWPYSYYYGYPAGGYYSPSYTANYYAAPSDDQGDSAPPASEAAPSTSEIDRDSGQLRLEVRPEDTSVYVDDRFCGTAREARGLRLPPGRHSVELVRPGFATERREVDITSGERSELSVEMQRR